MYRIYTMWIVVTLNILTIHGRGKYSINNNLPAEPQAQTTPKPFRMSKINIVWDKAQSMLKSGQLDDLFKALKVQDEKEIEYKHAKVNGREDEEGDLKADLLSHFNELISKFGLHDKLVTMLKPEDSKHSDKKFNQVTNDEDESSSSKSKPASKSKFKDPKVEKLWNMAAESGFSTRELKVLETELKHHQAKQDELVLLLNDMEDGLITNEIPQAPLPGERRISPKESYKLRKTKSKEIKESLSDDYDRLKSKVVPSDEAGFADPKVQQFWLRAQRANFTAEELSSLKEELKHLQRKIEKHEWISNRIEDAEADVKEGKSLNVDNHAELRERQKDFSRKIKKLATHFEDFIGTRDLSDL